MKLVDLDYINDMSKEITIFDILEQDGILKIDVPKIVLAISDYFEEYGVDSDILNTIISILLNCKPSKDDIKDIDLDKFNELHKILNEE